MDEPQPTPPPPVACYVCNSTDGKVEHFKHIEASVVKIPMPFGIISRQLYSGLDRWLQTCQQCGHLTHLATPSRRLVAIRGGLYDFEIVKEGER
jgi:hypothetical protein